MGPPNDSFKLVNITPMSLWFMVPITIVFMGFINHPRDGLKKIQKNEKPLEETSSRMQQEEQSSATFLGPRRPERQREGAV